jgi:hypothetical protein
MRAVVGRLRTKAPEPFQTLQAGPRTVIAGFTASAFLTPFPPPDTLKGLKKYFIYCFGNGGAYYVLQIYLWS